MTARVSPATSGTPAPSGGSGVDVGHTRWRGSTVVRWAVVGVAVLVIIGSIVVIALDASRQTADPIGDAMIMGVGCGREVDVSLTDPMQATITVHDDGVSDVVLTGTVIANRTGCQFQVSGPFSALGEQTLRVNGAPHTTSPRLPTSVNLPEGTAVPITVSYRTELPVDPAGLGRWTFGTTLNWDVPPAANPTRIPGTLAVVDGLVVDVKLPSSWFVERTATTTSTLPLRDHEVHFGVEGDRSRIGFQFGVEQPAVRTLVTIAPIALAAAVAVLVGLTWGGWWRRSHQTDGAADGGSADRSAVASPPGTSPPGTSPRGWDAPSGDSPST